MPDPQGSIDERFAALDERIKQLRRRLPAQALPGRNTPAVDPEETLRTVLESMLEILLGLVAFAIGL